MSDVSNNPELENLQGHPITGNLATLDRGDKPGFRGRSTI